MFTEAERVQIRRWLGYSAMYASRDPILESAITSAQSTAEGGSRPDNTTELAIRGWLAQLSTIETRWQELYEQMQANALDDIKIDPLRGLAGLFKIGRQYVGHISDALSTPVKRDVFSAPVPTSR